MKEKNYLTFIVGIVLVLIFGTLLFSFQVRQTDVALVTTFGKPTRDIHEPGLYWKWPWPIQKVQRFDKRIQNFEDRFEETMTQDDKQVLVMVYLGWQISDPVLFRERFGASATRAQNVLEGLARTAKLAVIGRHPFSHLISTDQEELKFVEMENEMLQLVQPLAKGNGMDVKFLGIKKLGLPESTTQNVFNRMREERQRHVQRLKGEGERAASEIRSAADRERAEVLAKADAKAKEIIGQADLEAAPYYAVLEKDPALSIFLLKVQAMDQSVKDHTTWVFDPNTSPFDLLRQPAAPAATPKPAEGRAVSEKK